MKYDCARLIGYTPYAERDGFAQLIFDKCGEMTIQIPDARELVIQEFAAVGNLADFTKVDADLTARPGDALIYCFKSEGTLIIGAVEQIAGRLLDIAHDMGDEGIKLQVAEVIGDFADAAAHRKKLRSIYRTTLGEGAEVAYLRGSVFPETIWRALINSIHDTEGLQKVTNNRNWILHQSHPSDDMFSADLATWFRSELRIDPARLSAKVASQLGPEFWAPRTKDKSDSRKTLGDIAALPRQEMRILELIRAILDDPNSGKALLNQFQDAGQFANNAAAYLRCYEKYLFPQADPTFLNHLVSQLYSMVYPKRRGVLMLDMANVLGHVDPIADGIANRMNRSNAMDVRHYSGLIATALEKRQTARASVVGTNRFFSTSA